MKKYWPIIKDACILITVSTLFVTLCNNLFRSLKKTAVADSLVTAINQENVTAVKDILSENEFKNNRLNAQQSFSEYLKIRAAKIDDQKRTPLMWAAYVNLLDPKKIISADQKRKEIVKVITERCHELDMNAVDGDGWTALMWAAWSGLTEVSEVLIKNGTSINISDKQGNTALSLAAQRGNVEIVKILLSHQANKLAVTKKGKVAKDFAQLGLSQYPNKEKAYQQILSLL